MTYPPQIDELLPRAEKLAQELGETPSRNRLMRELRVGAPKADAIRDALVKATSAASNARRRLRSRALRRSAGMLPVAPRPHRVWPNPKIIVAAPDADQPPTAPPLVAAPGHPAEPAPPPAPTVTSSAAPAPARAVRSWPVLVLALPAFVAIWSGWVGLGGLTGFGVVHPLPGIADDVSLNTAITLPIGVETYAAFAIHVWLSGRVPDRARRFARWSAIGSLVFGAAGQVAYHLMVAAGMTSAPWLITTAVSCLPVAVLGMGAALAHLVRAEQVAR